MNSTRTDKIMTDAEWRKLSAASRARCNQYGIEFDNVIRERDALQMEVAALKEKLGACEAGLASANALLGLSAK